MPYLDIILTVILLSICAYTDTKHRKIYNWVTLPLIPIGILNTIFLYGFYEGLMDCLWLIPAFILCLIFFKLNQIGAGDAKLVLSIGALMGLEYTLIILLISFILGWFYAAYQFLKRRREIGGSLKEHQKIMIPLGSIMLVAFGIVGGMQMFMEYIGML